MKSRATAQNRVNALMRSTRGNAPSAAAAASAVNADTEVLLGA